MTSFSADHAASLERITTPNEARRFVLEFTDERDFVRAASVLLGAAYVSGSEAVYAISTMPSTRSFGSIKASSEK